MSLKTLVPAGGVRALDGSLFIIIFARWGISESLEGRGRYGRDGAGRRMGYEGGQDREITPGITCRSVAEVAVDAFVVHGC